VNKKLLLVEDQFVEANGLQLILGKAGYEWCGIARSVSAICGLRLQIIFEKKVTVRQGLWA
jgi:hypothetical protein